MRPSPGFSQPAGCASLKARAAKPAAYSRNVMRYTIQDLFEILDLFANLVGCRPSLAKCYAFCVF
jgi:hypothetical protein